MASAYSDYDFLRDLQVGSDVAYRELYRRFHHVLLFSCYQRLRDRHAAEDVVSECFIRLLEKTERSFDSVAHLKNFLFKVAYNISTDVIRKRMQGHVYAAGLEEEPLEADVERKIIEADYVARVMELIEELPARQRETLKAVIFDEKKYKEVVVELNFSTVKDVEKTRKRGILNLIQRIYPTKAADVVFLLLSLVSYLFKK